MSHDRPTDHETTNEVLADIASAIRAAAPKPLAEPYPALDFTAPRITSADDRARLHGLAVLLVDRTTEAARTMRTENLTAEGLTALAAATTAATTALLACSTDDRDVKPDNVSPVVTSPPWCAKCDAPVKETTIEIITDARDARRWTAQCHGEVETRVVTLTSLPVGPFFTPGGAS